MMNTLNRLVVIVLLLVAMVLCTLALVLPLRVFNTISLQSKTLVSFLMNVRPIVRVPAGILFALTLDLILILFLIFEFRRPRAKAIRVQQASGGEVQISAASIADRLTYEVDQLPGVLKTEANVSSKRGGVAVELDVEMAAKLNVPEKADRIVETARRAVEETMGLKLARPPKVNLRAVPHPKMRKKKEPLPPSEFTDESVQE